MGAFDSYRSRRFYARRQLASVTMSSLQSTRRKTEVARARKAASKSSAQANGSASTAESFICPECGRTFTRAAALGAHRSRAHGVAGGSKAGARTRRTRRTQQAARPATRTRRAASTNASNGTGSRRGVNRDALLASIFPNGMPPREDVIRAANSWLDEAERLAQLR